MTIDYSADVATRWGEMDDGLEDDILRLGVRIGRLARWREKLLSSALADFRERGVRNMEDYRFLAHLTRLHPISSSATEASIVLGLSKAATAVRAERFEKDGLVERFERDGDRRSMEVIATEPGRKVAHEATLAIQGAYREMLDALDSEQLMQMEDLLRVLDLSATRRRLSGIQGT